MATQPVSPHAVRRYVSTVAAALLFATLAACATTGGQMHETPMVPGNVPLQNT